MEEILLWTRFLKKPILQSVIKYIELRPAESTRKTMNFQNNKISYQALCAVVVFGCFLVLGISGCQTTSSGSGNPMFSSPMFAPSATIPPPATGSYTVGDAVAYGNPGSSGHHHNPSYPPASPNGRDDKGYDQDSDSGEIEPFRSPDSSPYSASTAPSTLQTPLVPAVDPQPKEPAIQPFQSQYAGSVAPGSALITAPEVGDKIEIPTSAYRTESGMRVSSEAAFANTRGSSSFTQTAFVAPSATRSLPDSQSPELTQPGPVYAEKVE